MAPKGRTVSARAAVNTGESVKRQIPNWPPLTPLVPTENLYIDTRADGQILVIRNLFTSALCKKYVSFLSSLPLTTTPATPKRGEAVRVNDRFQVDDAAFATRLWQQSGLQHLIDSYDDQSIWQGDVLGLNPNIRIYRYRPGQFFDQHYDESNKIEFGDRKTPAKTTWTLLIYLTICEGGETAFYPEATQKGQTAPEPILVSPDVGTALLHQHVDCMLHEGKEVKSGEKWVLRSDLVVRR